MRGSVGHVDTVHSDSGLLTHTGNRSKIVFTDVINQPEARWIRLYLEGTVLGEGSVLRITSLRDGETQYLDQQDLQQWRRSTAYFNGNTILLELIADPGTTNRSIVSELAWGDGQRDGDPTCGYCDEDDRSPYSDNSVCRLLGGTYTCTGVIVDEHSHLITAGHCMGDGGALVAQFDVPNSNLDCTMNHPPVEDQFPVVGWLCQYAGPGNDWAAVLLGTNGSQERPYDRYGTYQPMATNVPSAGTAIQAMGYGDDLEQCNLADTLQNALGTITDVYPYRLVFDADVTYGSSGSPLSVPGTDRVVGLATHCPCPNVATRIDHPDFVAARELIFNGDASGDICESAVFAVQGDNAFSTTGNTDSDYGDPDESQCEDTYLDWDDSPDTWFAWQPPVSGTMSLSTCDSESFDTSLVVYEGTDCSSLQQVACNGDAEPNDDCQSYYSAIEGLEVSALSIYYIRLGGWQGATGSGTLRIDHVPASATGACCLDGSPCLDLLESECSDAGGTYQGEGTDCAGQPCVTPPTGACCTGLGLTCEQITQDACTLANGTWQGEGTSCVPNPCEFAPPTGACCTGSTCVELNQDDCSVAGGNYLGDGTLCESQTCTPPCPGDFDQDGEVDVDDLLTVIAYYGNVNDEVDLDGDGLVDVDDLLMVIGVFGPC
ncbi:MAG: S1 family peptidase [Phycisphaerales bacterium]|nr:S1 family peptidase [Phycisphaerales bacterium]